MLNSARYAKWPAIIGGTYLVLKHPSLINDFLVEVAKVINVHPLILQIVGWFFIIAPGLFILRWLLWLLTPLISSGLRGLSLFIAYISGRGAIENNR